MGPVFARRRITVALVALLLLTLSLFMLSGPALGAEAWSQVGSNSLGVPILAVCYANGTLYAGTSTGNVSQNALDGGAWTNTGTGTPGGAVRCLAYAGGKVYAGCNDGFIYENALSGGPWSVTGGGTPGGGFVYALLYANGKLYSAGNNGTVYENALAGGPWSQTGSNAPGSLIYNLAYGGGKLYAGCANGTVYENALAGGTWSQAGSNTPGAYVRDLAYGGGILYAACNNGIVYQNALAGGAWSQTGSNTPGSTPERLAYNGKLYVGTTGGAVYENELTGGAWTQAGSNTPGVYVEDMVFGGNMLYAGCYDNSISQLATAAPVFSVYLAEGSTAWGFETSVNIQNPNTEAVTARLTYMDPAAGDGAGVIKTTDVTMQAQSRATVNVNEDLGFATDVATRVDCLEGKFIAADRTVLFPTALGMSHPGSTNSIGVNEPANAWYFAEGSSAWGFECWTSVLNPNATDAAVELTYMLEGGGAASFMKSVPAYSRASFNMADDIGQQDAAIRVESDVPVVPERSMYTYSRSGTEELVRRDGHCSIGTTAPAKDFYLAEGTTAWGFTTYVVVQNPNADETKVEVTYNTPDGPVSQEPFTMPGRSRETIRVNDLYPGTDLSTHVSADLPVVAERAMYWANAEGPGEGMTGSVGVDAPHNSWYLPAGTTNGSTETFTVIQNPGADPIDLTIQYQTPTGVGNVSVAATIPARSRRTFDMADVAGDLPAPDAAIWVVCSVNPSDQVIVERAMYYAGRWSGSDTIGSFMDVY